MLMRRVYRVWYAPYLLDDEEDYIDVEAVSKTEAMERAVALGWVTYAEIISK